MRIKGKLLSPTATDVHTSGPHTIFIKSADLDVGYVVDGTYTGSIELPVRGIDAYTTYYTIQCATQRILVQSCTALRYNLLNVTIGDRIQCIYEGKRGPENEQFYSWAVLRARPQPPVVWEIAANGIEIRGPYQIKS